MRVLMFVAALVFLACSMVTAAVLSPWTVEPPARELKEAYLHSPAHEPALAESTHEFNVLKYTLNIQFEMSSDYLDGTSAVLCEARQAGLDSIVLNCVGLAVDSVTLSGKQLSYTLAGGNIYIDLDTTLGMFDTFEVSVAYNGYPASGYYWYDQSGMAPETTAYTSTEPSDSRYWYPCFDEPWDKADLGSIMSARVPLGYVAASNGLLTSVDTTAGTVTYSWREDNAIATYLISVAITKYVQILDQYVSALGDTIPIMHFVYPDDSFTAIFSFAKVPEMMGYYSGIFGEYPFKKYGHAVVDPFWGGMEHQTLTTILRWAAVVGWEAGVAHELAHQWWGDMVTCFTWPDIWINEGFATYAEALWAEYEYGTSAYHSNMWEKGFDYFAQDSTSRFPIYDPPILFNWGIVYCKGAWVLHMLRHVMPSDSSFLAIFPDYGETFKFGNASVEDFRAKAEQYYGADLAWFFQEWIYEQGHPQYNYGWSSRDLGGGDYEVKIQIEQIQTNAPPVFEMPVDLEIQTGSGNSTITVWNDQRFQQFTDTVALASAPTAVVFDPEDWVLDEHWQVPYGIAEKDRLASSPAGLEASPNPFRGSVAIALPARSGTFAGEVTVFDISGRLVKRIPVTRGEAFVTWNGSDQKGLPVPGGVYFLRSEAGRGPLTLKLLKLD